MQLVYLQLIMWCQYEYAYLIKNNFYIINLLYNFY